MGSTRLLRPRRQYSKQATEGMAAQTYVEGAQWHGMVHWAGRGTCQYRSALAGFPYARASSRLGALRAAGSCLSPPSKGRSKGTSTSPHRARLGALLQVTNDCDVVRLPLSYIHACSRRNHLTLRIGLSDDSGLRLGRVHDEYIGTLLICASARPGTVIPIDY